jgi:transcriptional regulator with XRE-family HTH domain
MALGEILRQARTDKGFSASEVAQNTRMKVQMVEDLEREDFHRVAATIYGKGFIKLYAEFVGLDPAPLIDEYIALSSGKQQSIVTRETPPATVIRRSSRSSMPDDETAAPPSPAIPAMEPPAAEGAPGSDDLFAMAARKTVSGRRRLRRPVAPPADTPPPLPPQAPPLPPAPAGPSLQERLTEQATVLKRRTQALYGHVVQRLKPIANTIGERVAASGIGDAPLKIVGLAIGVLLALLVVVAAVSQCGRVPTGEGSGEILLAVPMPEPYFD